MDLGLKDKNALITGGSRGLGLASAISLAKEGVNIIICARSEEDLSKAKSIIEKYDVKVHATKLDLANEDSIENLCKKSLESFKQIDILVNNVGGSLGTKSLVDSSVKDFQKVMDINTWAAINLTKLFISKMIEMIKKLEEKGYTYKTDDGSVFFKIANFQKYGNFVHNLIFHHQS